MRLSRILLWGLLLVAGAAALLGTASLFHPWLRPVQGALIQGGVVTVLYLALALGCAAARERGRAAGLMLSGIIVGAIALVLWIAMTVLAGPSTEWLWAKGIVWPTAWACLMLLIGVLLLPRNRGGRWAFLRRTSIVLTSLLAAQICLAVTCLGLHDLWGDWWWWSNLLLWPTWLAAGVVTVVIILPSVAGRWASAMTWLIGMLSCILLAHVGLVSVLYWRWTGAIPGSWYGLYDYEQMASRIGMVLGLLSLGAIAATFLTLWVPGLTGRSGFIGPAMEFALRCPRCGHEQTGHTGRCACRRCGLSIRVELV